LVLFRVRLSEPLAQRQGRPARRRSLLSCKELACSCDPSWRVISCENRFPLFAIMRYDAGRA